MFHFALFVANYFAINTSKVDVDTWEFFKSKSDPYVMTWHDDI